MLSEIQNCLFSSLIKYLNFSMFKLLSGIDMVNQSCKEIKSGRIMALFWEEIIASKLRKEQSRDSSNTRWITATPVTDPSLFMRVKLSDVAQSGSGYQPSCAGDTVLHIMCSEQEGWKILSAMNWQSTKAIQYLTAFVEPFVYCAIPHHSEYRLLKFWVNSPVWNLLCVVMW